MDLNANQKTKKECFVKLMRIRRKAQPAILFFIWEI